MQLVTWIILIALAVLQSSFIIHIPFFQFKPELILIFCVYLATRYDWVRGFWWGMACGAAMSICSIGDPRFFILVFASIGFVSGSFRGALFVDHNSTKIIILFFMSIAGTMAFALLTQQSGFSFFEMAFIKKYIIKIAVINCLFAVPLYSFFQKIYNKIEAR
ncbi:MAG: rod shape-determining protein MreD [Candidatus Aureabacteria bacterium]|nr:rod shape-determining protein MreD [Candidatus Auribacterota bacterium]